LDDILTSSADFLIEGGTENRKKGIRVIPFNVFVALPIAAQHDDTKSVDYIAATRTESNYCSRHFVFNNNVGHKGTIFIESVLR
jgi:hypothetical protein